MNHKKKMYFLWESQLPYQIEVDIYYWQSCSRILGPSPTFLHSNQHFPALTQASDWFDLFLDLLFYYFVQLAYWHHSLIPTANFGDFFLLVPEMNLKILTKINKIGRIRLDWGDFRGQRLFNCHKYVINIFINILL